MSVWPQASLSQRATWPPSAAVRQRSMALMTFIWSRLTWPALAARHAAPWSRKMSATSRGRAMGGALCRRRLFSPGLVGLPARLAEQVERALDGGDHGCSNPRVACRRIELGMAEQRLNHANICPALEQVGCKAVAQRMQRHRFLDPGCLRCLVEQAVELARRHRPARLAAREQPAFLRSHALVVAPWARRPPFPQQAERLGRQHHMP